MNTSDRINQRMKQLNLVPSDLMQKAGASRGAVSQWRMTLQNQKSFNAKLTHPKKHKNIIWLNFEQMI